MKRIIAIAALLGATALTAPAMAADAYSRDSLKDTPASEASRVNWSGVYIGTQLGHGSTTIGFEDSQGGIAADGLLGGLRLGIDIARGNILFGVYGEYNWSDEALEFGPVTLLQQDNDWALMGRLGFISGRTLFYGTAGYTQTDYSSGSSGATVDGWKAGGGIEHMIAPNLTLGLEATRAWLDADDFGGAGAEDYVDITDDRIMARIAYKINGTTFGF